MPLDIAAGFLGAIIYAFFTGEDLTVPLLLLGATFALLPDVDFLVSAVRKGSISKVNHTHRDLLHYPIPFLLAGGALVFLVAPQYLWLFLALATFHFVHDSMGTGWGIPWLFPFSRLYAKAFCTPDGVFSWKSIAIWTVREREAVIRRLHDPDWIRHEYRSLSVTLIVEGGVFALMLVLAFLATRWL